jgi:hypothetical protein
MTSLVESVAPLRLAVGTAVFLGVTGALGLGYVSPSPPVAVALVVLSLTQALRGLRPLGETIALRLAEMVIVALFGVAALTVGNGGAYGAVAVLLGLAGLGYYGWRASEDGVWAPVRQVGSAESFQQ